MWTKNVDCSGAAFRTSLFRDSPVGESRVILDGAILDSGHLDMFLILELNYFLTQCG